MNTSLQEKTKEKSDIMKWIARGIVRSRFVIFLLFGLAAVYCALSIGRVRVSNDLTTFLPPRRGRV